ncbi:MAG: hypothetical protein PHI29_05430 [Gallionella sp.]|nr:hypothetical protein [Gallionella sp.]
MKAIVVIRKDAAAGLGHVGWGFYWDQQTSIVGSTENPLGTAHTSAFEKGAWKKRIRHEAVLTEFRSGRVLVGVQVPPYRSYKVIEVGNPDPQYAWKVVNACEQKDYWLSGFPEGRNCMDDAYDILRAFGCANLPTPQQAVSPINWFNLIAAIEHDLYAEKTLRNSMHAEESFSMPEVKGFDLPVWRQEGTAEFEALMPKTVP